jgi:AraC-like DNA-binding protein
MLIEQLLIHLVRAYRPTRLSGGKEAHRPSSAIREIIAYVDANLLEKITLGELAFLFKTNRATLCREFKRETGCTLIAYINEKKLALAKKRITESNDTFTEISRELHFESVHYFTRFFKQHTGLTPKEYRRAENEP